MTSQNLKILFSSCPELVKCAAPLSDSHKPPYSSISHNLEKCHPEVQPFMLTSICQVREQELGLNWDPALGLTVWDPTFSGHRFWNSGRIHLRFGSNFEGPFNVKCVARKGEMVWVGLKVF